MRSADIAAHPTAYFAVKVPHYGYGRRREGSDIVKAKIAKVTDGKALLDATPTLEHPLVSVALANVLALWDVYDIDRAHEAALAEDRRRDHRLEFERQRAERRAWIESWLPAFESVVCEPTGSANVDRPPVNFGEELRRIFVHDGCIGASFTAEHFAAIAYALAPEKCDALHTATA